MIREEVAGTGPVHPLPEAERQAGDSQSRKARDKLGPRDHILYQTADRLPVAKQVFLGSWTVTSTRRVTARDQLPK